VVTVVAHHHAIHAQLAYQWWELLYLLHVFQVVLMDIIKMEIFVYNVLQIVQPAQ